MNINRRHTDRRLEPTCLVSYVSHLDTEMQDIFPGGFYADYADNVVQTQVQKRTLLPSVLQVEFIRATSDYSTNQLLVQADVIDWIESVSSETPVLLDLAKRVVLTPDKFVWNNAPEGKKPCLYMDDTSRLLYSFDCPSWIPSVCNLIAADCATEKNCWPTEVGKELTSVLAGNYFGLTNPKDPYDLSFIKNVDIRGNTTLSTPESYFPAGCLDKLNEFVNKNIDKFRPKSSLFVGESVKLSTIIRDKGISAPLYNKTINSGVKVDVEIDMMQDIYKSAYIAGGDVWATVFPGAPTTIKSDTLKLFATIEAHIFYNGM